MNQNRLVVFLVANLLSLSGYSIAQCPQYTAPPFTRAQAKQLCNELKKQQDILAHFKIEMITLQPHVPHHVGRIFAVLVGGFPGAAGGPDTGGVLVPFLPPPGSDQVVTFQSLGGNTCSVTLHFNSAQDFSVTNECTQPLKATVLFSGNDVIPTD